MKISSNDFKKHIANWNEWIRKGYTATKSGYDGKRWWAVIKEARK